MLGVCTAFSHKRTHWQIPFLDQRMNLIFVRRSHLASTTSLSPSFSKHCARILKLIGAFTYISPLASTILSFTLCFRIITDFLGFLFSATCFASVFLCCGCGMVLFRVLVAVCIYTFGAGIFLVRALAHVLIFQLTDCPNNHQPDDYRLPLRATIQARRKIYRLVLKAAS